MGKKERIFAFWWSSTRFQGKVQDNFGDILSKYLVEKISGKKVIWKQPKKMRFNFFKRKIYFTTGSIITHANKHSVVWGSGIISRNDSINNAEFLAVRGPETYAYLKSKNYKVNRVFGDPAILLPQYYKSKVEKKFDLGIIPHYVDFKKISTWYENDESVKVINLLNNDIEEVVDEILSCKQILSSSLHGVIVSHAYKTPAVWVRFSDKLFGDGVKFVDYFKSVKIEPYHSTYIQEKISVNSLNQLFLNRPLLPKEGVIEELGMELFKVCPFKL